MKLLGLLELIQKKITPFSAAKRTYECEWCVGHGGFMLPDPCSVPHADLRQFVKGKRTRVTVEIIGQTLIDIPEQWQTQPESPQAEPQQLELPLTYGETNEQKI